MTSKPKRTQTSTSHKPPSSDKLRDQFRQLQLALLVRAQKPVELSFDTKTVEGVAQFVHDVIQARLDKKLGPEDVNCFKGMCEVLLKIYLPTPTIKQEVPMDTHERERGKKTLEEMDEQGRNAVYEYITAMATNEARPGNG